MCGKSREHSVAFSKRRRLPSRCTTNPPVPRSSTTCAGNTRHSHKPSAFGSVSSLLSSWKHVEFVGVIGDATDDVPELTLPLVLRSGRTDRDGRKRGKSRKLGH